ncbi:uncharacterized protein LOC101851995 [Aplysia californica]|uniref:Uncharacterized protein LOC101851995 n=1 Tax=Aplysia californica TaxID=6500 RepID=A0ABM1ADF5_APLCA|nr:uncharacterized protein LOC101851995 [Aplysia californica]
MPPSLCILVWVYLGLVHPSRAINLSSIDLGLPVTHIASNPTSDIFVGGVNFLAHLSADLSINMNVSIGPVEEAEFCWPDPAPCDNHVKILAIDSTLNQLLVCGSAYQGTCTAHSLYDIGQWTCVRPPAAQRNADVLAYNPRNNFLLEFLPPVTEFREFAATGSSEGLGAAGVTGSSGLGVDVTGEGEGEDGAGECRSSLSFIPGDGYYYDDLPPETSQEPDTGQEPDSGQQMDRAKLGENREKAAWLAPAPAPAQNGREPGSGPGSESESESEFTQQGNGELVIFSRFFVAGNPHRSSPDEMVPWTFAQKRLTFDWRTSQFEMSSARGRLDGAPIGFDMSSRVRSEGYVNYIHSFQWGNHSYFLFHQETVCGEGSRQHACVRTMLSRVCNQEDSMLPYVELPLTCKNGTSSTYSLLTSAALGTVLQQKQTSKVHIPVLVTAFGNGTEPRSTVADPSYGSVVCVFPLDKLVSSEFSLAEQFCDSGPGLIKGADWIEGVETNCQKIESESESTLRLFTVRYNSI